MGLGLRQRYGCGTSWPQSPQQIGSTLINKTISTGRGCGTSQQRQERLAAPQRYHSIAFLFLTQAVAEPRQFQQSRSSRAGREKVKAIEHPVNFQNKTQYSAHVAYHNFTSTLLRHDRWHQVSSQSIKGSQRVGNMEDERLIVERGAT